ADEESPHKQPENAHRACRRERRCEIEVEAAEEARGIEKASPEPNGTVVERDQGEGAESPEDERVRQSRQRSLPNDLGLAEDLGEEIPCAPGDMVEVKARVLAGGENPAQDRPEAAPEQRQRSHNQKGENELLCDREVLWLGQRSVHGDHIQTHSRYTMRARCVVDGPRARGPCRCEKRRGDSDNRTGVT